MGMVIAAWVRRFLEAPEDLRTVISLALAHRQDRRAGSTQSLTKGGVLRFERVDGQVIESDPSSLRFQLELPGIEPEENLTYTMQAGNQKSALMFPANKHTISNPILIYALLASKSEAFKNLEFREPLAADDELL